MYKLENKVALVTGASKGIGRAIALTYAQSGAKVAVTARTTSQLETLATEIEETGQEALPITADLGQPAEVERVAAETLAHFGQVDVLVNNAAIIHPRVDLVDFDPALWREVIEVNLIAGDHVDQSPFAQHDRPSIWQSNQYF